MIIINPHKIKYKNYLILIVSYYLHLSSHLRSRTITTIFYCKNKG